MRYIQSPVNSAAGTVMAIVKVPQELSLRAFTTATPRPASAMMMIVTTAIEPTTPATGLISIRAISARLLPL